MKRQPGSPGDSIFRFLDLPAELRNTIYKMFLPDDKGRKTIILDHRSAFLHKLACHHMTPRLPFEYLQLAHINRQIRQEFLPLYLPKMRSDMHFFHASEFAQTFLLPHLAETNNTMVTIDFSGIIRGYARAVDVYDLLKFFRKAPNVSLETERYGNRTQHGIVSRTDRLWPLFQHHNVIKCRKLRVLLKFLTKTPETRQEKIWAQYFDRYVTAISIEPFDELHITISVKSSAVEYWMGNSYHKSKIDGWCRKVGFPEIVDSFGEAEHTVEVKGS